MADIHILPEKGDAVAYPEERIPELISAGMLSPASLYWREGMAGWEPIGKFRLAARAPARHSERLPAAVFAGGTSSRLVDSQPVTGSTSGPRAHERETGSPSRHPTAVRSRFRFRRNPWPITIVLELWLLVCLGIALLELSHGVNAYLHTSRVPAPTFAQVQAIDVSWATPSRSSGPGQPAVAELKASLGRDTPITPDQWLAWAGVAANLLLAVPYFIWLHRTTVNCRQLSSMTRVKPGMAIGNYFIPFVNLFRPCQEMQELWRLSGNPRSGLNDRPSILVGMWWGLGLVTAGVAVETWALFLGLKAADDALVARLFFVILKSIQSCWYVLFIAVVAMILQRQSRVIAQGRQRSRSGSSH